MTALFASSKKKIILKFYLYIITARYLAGTDNVYNAMFAMLGAVANHNKTSQAKINTVLCPGLGTGTGAVPLKEAARQMALAYRNFLHPTTNMVWKNLKNRHDEIVGK